MGLHDSLRVPVLLVIVVVIVPGVVVEEEPAGVDQQVDRLGHQHLQRRQCIPVQIPCLLN